VFAILAKFDEIIVPVLLMPVLFDFFEPLVLEKGDGFEHDLPGLLVRVLADMVFGIQKDHGVTSLNLSLKVYSVVKWASTG
jgi:hypothetical protein